MAPVSLLIASLDYAQAGTYTAGLYQYLVDHFPVFPISEIFSKRLPEWLAQVSEWLTRPEILLIITVWWITFVVVMILTSCGFTPVGVAAGSAAAYFQSWMYGGFTPAGGFFATLTSLGMLGTLMPVQVILSSAVATIVTMILWKIRYRI